MATIDAVSSGDVESMPSSTPSIVEEDVEDVRLSQGGSQPTTKKRIPLEIHIRSPSSERKRALFDSSSAFAYVIPWFYVMLSHVVAWRLLLWRESKDDSMNAGAQGSRDTTLYRASLAYSLSTGAYAIFQKVNEVSYQYSTFSLLTALVMRFVSALALSGRILLSTLLCTLCLRISNDIYHHELNQSIRLALKALSLAPHAVGMAALTTNKQTSAICKHPLSYVCDFLVILVAAGEIWKLRTNESGSDDVVLLHLGLLWTLWLLHVPVLYRASRVDEQSTRWLQFMVMLGPVAWTACLALSCLVVHPSSSCDISSHCLLWTSSSAVRNIFRELAEADNETPPAALRPVLPADALAKKWDSRLAHLVETDPLTDTQISKSLVPVVEGEKVKLGSSSDESMVASESILAADALAKQWASQSVTIVPVVKAHHVPVSRNLFKQVSTPMVKERKATKLDSDEPVVTDDEHARESETSLTDEQSSQTIYISAFLSPQDVSDADELAEAWELQQKERQVCQQAEHQPLAMERARQAAEDRRNHDQLRMQRERECGDRQRQRDEHAARFAEEQRQNHKRLQERRWKTQKELKWREQEHTVVAGDPNATTRVQPKSFHQASRVIPSTPENGSAPATQPCHVTRKNSSEVKTIGMEPTDSSAQTKSYQERRRATVGQGQRLRYSRSTAKASFGQSFTFVSKTPSTDTPTINDSSHGEAKDNLIIPDAHPGAARKPLHHLWKIDPDFYFQ